MMTIKKGFLITIIFVMLAISVSAQVGQEYHLKLLAVQEEAGGKYTGSDADLFLELKEGSGRVFLDTFPLTKLDTQISTRFAKDLACNHFNLECEKYDFIYTIKSKSNIIGGPSAGAAITALTTIALLDLDYTKEIAITGTINSGGIIGPVGGVKEKLTAAANAGLKKVLIAQGNREFQEDENQTKIDLIEYAKNNLSLEVVEVMGIDEVLLHLTGKEFNNKNFSIEESKEYTKIMKGLQDVLCGRTEQIQELIDSENIKLSKEAINQSVIKKEDAEKASEDKDHYSAASFCFGNNILLKEQYYLEKELSFEQTKQRLEVLGQKTTALIQKIDKEKIETISDLQTLMVVKERLNDVTEQIKTFNTEITAKDLDQAHAILAYSEERFFSALSWMQFFSMPGKKFVLDEEKLEQSCFKKISEAEERHQYVSLFLGQFTVKHIAEKITLSKDSLAQKDYELCLIKASQAKAEANAILSSLGLSNETLPKYLESKTKAVERIIYENSAEGIFPILGYSYYQYANSLKEQEYTSLIYLEYALEISDLEIYFPEEKTFLKPKLRINKEWLLIIEGFILGILVTLGLLLLCKVGFKKKPRLKFIKK
jgi:uncharacterized protein